MARTDVIAPGSGLVMEQVRIVAWLKPEGARVEKGEILYEIETDKATIEVEAPASGYLQIVVQAGETLEPDQVVATINDSARTSDDAVPAPKPGPTEAGQVRPAGGRVAAGGAEGTPRLTPAARRRARELGLDPQEIRAAGSKGRVSLGDVERLTTVSASGLSPMRRRIAQRMMLSAREVPQFSISRDVNMSAAREWHLAAHVSYSDIIILAAAKALKKHATFRAHFENEGLVESEHVHIGVAIAVDDGLIVPVLRDADRRSVEEIAKERDALEHAARAGKLPADAVTGAVLSISNLGPYGIDQFVALVNPPEASILAVGRIADRVVALGGQPTVEPMVTLTLTVDHRVADGAAAALFLADIAATLEAGSQ